MSEKIGQLNMTTVKPTETAKVIIKNNIYLSLSTTIDLICLQEDLLQSPMIGVYL